MNRAIIWTFWITGILAAFGAYDPNYREDGAQFSAPGDGLWHALVTGAITGLICSGIVLVITALFRKDPS